MKWQHVLTGIEIFLLAALPAWLQSPTGSAFIHSHVSIADVIAAAYVGFRAVNLATSVANPVQPVQPAQPKE